MLLKELAHTGVSIPEIGIGTSNYKAGPRPLRQGLDAGALFLDTAECYGTEDVVGEAVKGIRERVFIATKVSPEHFREVDLCRSVDASLLRMRIDTIDLLQLHYPNPTIPIAETIGAIRGLVRAGKVRFIGVSNFSVAELAAARKAAGECAIVSNQVRYNLIDRTIEKELLPYCRANGITVIAYTPLARGVGRIEDCDAHGLLSRIARETGRTPAQVALNWCVSKDGIIAIPMSNSTAHLLENCAASDWRLNADQLALLDIKIEFRHRNRFDQFVRSHMPGRLQNIAAQSLKLLPRGLRRRLV